MKFIANISMCDPTFYVPLAQAAEAARASTPSRCPTSIAYPKESSSTYPYNFDGTREFLENKPFIEPIVAIAAMAAVTTTIEFHTFVLKMPIRHPVIYAKEATSLAVLSGNRFVLGVGTSPWPDDYEIVQLPWEGRGRRFDECIEIVRGLAAGGYFEHHGEFYDFPAIKMEPVPTRADPGAHRRARRRATAPRRAPRRRLDGRGRHARRPDPDDRPHERPAHGSTAAPASAFDIYATTPESFTVDGIKQLEDLGVTHTAGGFGRFNPYGARDRPRDAAGEDRQPQPPRRRDHQQAPLTGSVRA